MHATSRVYTGLYVHNRIYIQYILTLATLLAASHLVVGDDDDLPSIVREYRPLRLHELGVLAAEVLTVRLLSGLCLEVLTRLSVLPSHRRAYHTRRWRDEVDRRNPKREVQPRGSVVDPDLLLFILHHRGLRRVVRPGPLPLVGLPVSDLTTHVPHARPRTVAPTRMEGFGMVDEV